MIRNFLAWSTVFLIIGSVRAQEIPRVPADMKAYEKEMAAFVYTGTTYMVEYKYIIYDGNVTNERYKTRITQFDRQGRMKESTSLDRKGDKKSILLFRYDQNNLPLLETEYLTTGEIIGKTAYNYNDSGFLKEITWYHGNEYIIDKTLFEVDESEKTMTAYYMYSPDSVRRKVIFYYSDLYHGDISAEDIYVGENQFHLRINYLRDEDHKVVSEKWFNKDDVNFVNIDYTYSPDGKLVLKEKQFDTGRRVKNAEYNYSSLLMLTGEILYNDSGEIIRYRKFTYK